MAAHWDPQDKENFEIAVVGQITTKSEEGQKIIELLKEKSEKEIKTIVEIGTWNGLGSTVCILDGIKGKQVTFWSLECNKDKIEAAREYLHSRIDNRVKLVWGSIIEQEDELHNEEYMDNFPILAENGNEKRWFIDDLMNCRNGAKILHRLPEKIDFLLLDGGEYTTLYEFNKLFSRCSAYIALDDVNADKCREVRRILKGNAEWQEICYIENRNGFSIFKKMNGPGETTS